MTSRWQPVALFVLTVALTAANGMAGGRTRAELAAYGDSVLTQPLLRGASWTVLVYSLSGDSVIYERDADRLLIPASLTKLVTSAAALDALGADFRFSTFCRYTGDLTSAGEVTGDLLVQAGGDPSAELKSVDSLGKGLLPYWADRLYASGLRAVRGNLVICTAPFAAEAANAAWEIGDVAGGFAPAVDGFGFNNNVCRLTVMPGGKAGDPATFTVDPPYAPVHVRLRVQTVNPDRAGWLELAVAELDSSVVVTGEIPAGDDGEYLWLPVQEPALYFARALHAALRQRGIRIDGSVRVDRINAAAGAELAAFHSAPLPRVLELVNKDSDNYTAEYVLRAIGKATGEANRRGGLRAVERFLKSCGVDQRDARCTDGSGLARQNLVSARALVDVLRYMHRHPYGDQFKASLAVAGRDGTLAFRLSHNGTAGRIVAKTGTMTYVSGLAGYGYTGSGEIMAFALLCNNFSTSLRHIRGVQDRLLERMILSAE